MTNYQNKLYIKYLFKLVKWSHMLSFMNDELILFLE